MKQLTFSVIVPVYNEKNGILEFLESIYQQTRKPDEIIIVDGKSTDGTYEILQEEAKKWRIIVFSHACNIAEARNFAIKQTHHDIVLCTDAWCKVDQHRCEEIMKIYETTDEVVVWGKSDFIITTPFQRLAKTRLISPDPNFHFVSSRNISFYKTVWKEVWWYPEYLTKWGEDTYFNYKIEQQHKIYYCPTAIVQRGMGKTYKDFYTMYRNYTQWDAEVFIIHKTIQSWSIMSWVKFSLGFLFLFCCLIISFYFWLFALLVATIFIWLYKRSPWWFLFDLQFSLAKMLGVTIWLRKWLLAWRKIKQKMK